MMTLHTYISKILNEVLTDAFKPFMGTEMDVLAVGKYVLYKEHQNEALKENYEERYDLD